MCTWYANHHILYGCYWKIYSEFQIIKWDINIGTWHSGATYTQIKKEELFGPNVYWNKGLYIIIYIPVGAYLFESYLFLRWNYRWLWLTKAITQLRFYFTLTLQMDLTFWETAMIIYLSSPQILIGHYFLSCVSIIWLFWCDKLTNSGMWGLLVWENFYCSFSFVGSFFRVRVLVGGFFSQHFKYFTPLSFCLQSFWGEVVCYSYICFSIGKAFYPSGSFQNFVFVWKWWT